MVRVSIFGQEYTVKAKADSNYIADVASYVDKEMREVEESLSSTQSGTRIAILAAMSITDDLFSVRRDRDSVVEQVEDKAATLVEFIDETMVLS
ncbi:MAG: cell division protein ZapA [Candidatus Neomarinimicrobiota bacterium]